MIEFRGELSKSSKEYLIKKESKNCIIVIIGSLLFCIPFIVLSIINNWIFAIGVIPFVFISIASLIPPRGKILKLLFPIRVSINDDIIICKGENFEVANNIASIKKIIAGGDWYHIIFKFPHKSFRFLCQKDLITEGTIEEFEETFKNKIVKL